MPDTIKITEAIALKTMLNEPVMQRAKIFVDGGIVDYHTHCLPGMDDGAKNVEISVELLKLLKQQGVVKVVATPHFTRGDEDVPSFLERRAVAYRKLEEHPSFGELPPIMLGAEVLVQPGLSSTDLRPLCIGDTNMLLLEPPFAPLRSWVIEEIQNIVYSCKVVPVLAHVERYYEFYSKEHYDTLFSLDDCILQINADAFLKNNTMRFVKSLAKSGYEILVGSDCHNLEKRAPHFDFARKNLEKIHKKYFES